MKIFYFLMTGFVFLSSVIAREKTKKPEGSEVTSLLPACAREGLDDRWQDQASISNPEAAAPSSPLTLWYRFPAKSWNEALPIGNGRLGAMIYGGVADERLQLNEDTLWPAGAKIPTKPEAAAALPEIRKLLFAGKNLEATALIQKSWVAGKGVGSYETLGDLLLESPGVDSVTNYQRRLDLNNGLVSVEYRSQGVQYRREIIASAPAAAIIVRFTADQPGHINLRMTLKREANATCITDPSDPRSILLKGTVEAPKNSESTPLNFAARATVLAEKGTVKNSNGILNVINADAVTLVIAARSDYNIGASPRGKDPIAACTQTIRAVEAKSWPLLLSEHQMDYRKLFGSFTIDLGKGSPELASLSTDERLRRYAAEGSKPDPELEAMTAQFGRYLLISSSRPGSMPANLQGRWCWQLRAPWNGDYHNNINVQMNYWPAEVTGLGSCHLPLIDLLDLIALNGAKVAKEQYQSGGWVAHLNSDIWGYAGMGAVPFSVWQVGGVWLSLHAWEHYQFTDDRDFLEKRGWPLMKGAARFTIDTLVEAPIGTPVAGKLVTSPSFSPENRFLLPDGKEAALCYGPTMDLMLIHELLSACVQAASILNRDEEFKQECQRTLAKLAPLQISPTTHGIQEWPLDYPESDPTHRHVSNLFGLFPGSMMTSADPQMMEAARNSLIRREGDKIQSTGWGMAWRLCLWARAGGGEQAYQYYRGLIGGHLLPNLFNGHKNNQVDKAKFQIDGNFGATAGVAEMLLQSHLQVEKSEGKTPEFLLQLLPALPKAWAEGSVTGLRARGGFSISETWKQGVLTQAVISSEKGGRCEVCYQGKTVKVEVLPGKTVTVDGVLFKPKW